MMREVVVTEEEMTAKPHPDMEVGKTVDPPATWATDLENPAPALNLSEATTLKLTGWKLEVMELAVITNPIAVVVPSLLSSDLPQHDREVLRRRLSRLVRNL